MSEAKPIQGAVRLGVEIEGIGYITIAWLNSDARRPSAMAGLAMADKAKLKEADLNQLSDMKETIKRQPLVRSHKFCRPPESSRRTETSPRGVSPSMRSCPISTASSVWNTQPNWFRRPICWTPRT